MVGVSDLALDISVACLLESRIDHSFLFSFSTVALNCRAAYKLAVEFLLITFKHLLFCKMNKKWKFGKTEKLRSGRQY